jgi:tight adherence protein B
MTMRFIPLINSTLLMISLVIITRFGFRSTRRRMDVRAGRDAERYSGWSTELLLGWDSQQTRKLARAVPAGVIVVGLLVWFLTGSLVFALAAAFGAYKLPGALYRMARNRRWERLDEQLPEALNVMVSSARAGRSLSQAIADVSEKAPGPAGEEFGVIAKQINAGGLSVEQALARARARIPVESFSMAATAMITSLSRGGDILLVLERIADSTRELSRLRQKIRTETSAVRAQEKVILLMTPVFCLLVCLFDAEFPQILFHTIAGNLILVAVVGLQAVSVMWIRKIIRAAI